MLALGQAEAGHVRDAEALGQFLDDEVIGARPFRRLDQLRAEQDVLVAAAAIDVVMLEEHRRGQHDIGELGRVGHELLVHAGEEVVAQKALDHQPLLRRDVHRIGVLDQHRRHRRAAIERVRRVHQHRADPRMIEIADIRIAQPGAFEQALVELEDVGVGVERAATLILPAAGHGSDRQRRVHVDRAVALAGEAVAEAEVGSLASCRRVARRPRSPRPAGR